MMQRLLSFLFYLSSISAQSFFYSYIDPCEQTTIRTSTILQNVVSYIGRFNMIEADRDMQLAIRNDLKANNAKITTAKYSGYVTIYDFAVNLKEEIKAGKVETINETIVGIQVKLINNENTQYVVGSGQGRASTVGKGFLMNPNMEWNQSSLSSASNKAMETAVVNVIRAIDRRGW